MRMRRNKRRRKMKGNRRRRIKGLRRLGSRKHRRRIKGMRRLRSRKHRRRKRRRGRRKRKKFRKKMSKLLGNVRIIILFNLKAYCRHYIFFGAYAGWKLPIIGLYSDRWLWKTFPCCGQIRDPLWCDSRVKTRASVPWMLLLEIAFSLIIVTCSVVYSLWAYIAITIDLFATVTRIIHVVTVTSFSLK